MLVELKPITKESRIILENLFPYYIYDMSEFMRWNPDERGLFTYNNDNFDKYWLDEGHHPFFIYADGELAGFVLIRPYPQQPSTYDIEQFFVLRKFSGRGVGKLAFNKVVNTFPGQWQVRVLLENLGALSFWKSVISKVDQGYQYHQALDVDLTMHFFHFDTTK
ncbi:GNAT family N-acetyltransferase [Vibrio sp. T187]|uniref:GNAT family N-acetyltransferase n=1 Tax=Vibrio TaxID=662 RepID=UPI0010C9FC05|nr:MULTISPECIES: GNAT family N-acetyltransferase [Vibrio]MBW3698239.1 GNAT family N-acetyltransferase [Vibrio sp. T187]